MGYKYEVTGKAVVYTEEGAKILDSEVRRYFNANADYCEFRFDNKTKKELGEKYLLIGGARTVPTDNIYAQAAYQPERVEWAYKYTQTKFFRLMIDLMKLAQFAPINKANYMIYGSWFYNNSFVKGMEPDIDFTKSVKEIDAQFYRKHEFTPHMIEFVEARYSYDEL